MLLSIIFKEGDSESENTRTHTHVCMYVCMYVNIITSIRKTQRVLGCMGTLIPVSLQEGLAQEASHKSKSLKTRAELRLRTFTHVQTQTQSPTIALSSHKIMLS